MRFLRLISELPVSFLSAFSSDFSDSFSLTLFSVLVSSPFSSVFSVLVSALTSSLFTSPFSTLFSVFSLSSAAGVLLHTNVYAAVAADWRSCFGWTGNIYAGMMR